MLGTGPQPEDMPGVVQDETPRKRIKIRSSFDPRWLAVMVGGVLLSLGYYALLIWAGVSAVMWMLGS